MLGLYDCSAFSEKGRWIQHCVWELNWVFYVLIVSLIFESVNLSCKIVAQNDGCVFMYYCGGQKNNLRL